MSAPAKIQSADVFIESKLKVKVTSGGKLLRVYPDHMVILSECGTEINIQFLCGSICELKTSKPVKAGVPPVKAGAPPVKTTVDLTADSSFSSLDTPIKPCKKKPAVIITKKEEAEEIAFEDETEWDLSQVVAGTTRPVIPVKKETPPRRSHRGTRRNWGY